MPVSFLAWKDPVKFFKSSDYTFCRELQDILECKCIYICDCGNDKYLFLVSDFIHKAHYTPIILNKLCTKCKEVVFE